MLLALQTAITSLLETSLPALFTGGNKVQVDYGADDWTLDPLSADPVAGEPGPADAVDQLAFDPTAPTGPYLLTRPPYPGPKRVYLRSPDGELVPLMASELTWSTSNPASFTVQPRAGRELTGFDQIEVLYGIVAAGTQLKALHQGMLTLTAADAAKAEEALALALAVLALNREAIREQGAFAYTSGGYQTQGTLKTLSFAGGSNAAATRTVTFSAEVDLKLERLLGEDEGKPITEILSPGRPGGARPIDIDPVVQA